MSDATETDARPQTADDARARVQAQQADAVERLAAATERQNELLEALVDAVAYGGRGR